MSEVIGAQPRTSSDRVVSTPQVAHRAADQWTSRELDVQGRLEHIATMLIVRRRELASEIVRLVKREIPDYQSPPGEALEHIAEHITLLASMLRGERVGPEDFAFIKPHATRRAADGVPLPTFLHAFRLGIRVLWDTVIADTGADLTARAGALSAASPFLESLNASSTQAAAAYLVAQQSLTAEGMGARRDLLEQLLAGRPLGSRRMHALAAEAGLQEDARCAVIVATYGGPLPPEPEPARAAIGQLVRAAASTTRPLNVARHDELVIIRALRKGELERLSRSVQAAQTQLAERGMAVRIGVSTEYEGLPMIPAAYAEARRAAEAIGPAGGFVSLSQLRPIDYLASHADDVAARLVPQAISVFIAEDLARDGSLIDTVLAYADSDMNLARTAERLHIHVNTARYRLSRIAERTGCAPRSLGDVLDLVLAIKMLAGPR